MGVVDLNHGIIRKVIQVGAFCHTFVQNQSCRIGHHKILLVYTQKTAAFIAVIRIQKQRQIFRILRFIKNNAFLHQRLIHRFHIKQMQLCRTVFITNYINIIHSGLHGKSTEMDFISLIRFCQPGLRCDPWIRLFFLQVVFKYLAE